jgi:hypothetical protein
MSRTAVPEIINATILGFEQQKRQIDIKIGELRALLPAGSTQTAATPEPAITSATGKHRGRFEETMDGKEGGSGESHAEMNMTLPESSLQNIVCDLHLTGMTFGQVRHGGKLIKVHEGFACLVDGCTRFFGTDGYSDLRDGEFANVRTEPSCSSQHETQPMYIQPRQIAFSGSVRFAGQQYRFDRERCKPMKSLSSVLVVAGLDCGVQSLQSGK